MDGYFELVELLSLEAELLEKYQPKT